MKLALITQDFPPSIGGIQTYSFELAKRIAPWCKEIVVIAPGTKEDMLEDEKYNFNILRINCRNTLIGFFAVKNGLPYLKEKGIDTVFHAQWQTMNFSIKGKQRGIVNNIICAAHGRELLFNPFLHIPFLGKWYNRHMIKSLAMVDSFIAVSKYTGIKLKELGFEHKPIEVIGNGTNPEDYYPKDVAELKEALGLTGKKILVTVSRIVERKGIDTCIKAMSRLITRFPDLMYVIVGNGPDRERLEKLVKLEGVEKYVMFMGRVPSTLDYYNLADVFVMPSRSVIPDVEGFGITFLEANACGVPVIGSNSGGIPDAIEHGRSGYLIEEGNTSQLVSYIEQLLSQPSIAEEMGKYGKERVENKFNWDHCAKETYEVIQNASSSK